RAILVVAGAGVIEAGVQVPPAAAGVEGVVDQEGVGVDLVFIGGVTAGRSIAAFIEIRSQADVAEFQGLVVGETPGAFQQRGPLFLTGELAGAVPVAAAVAAPFAFFERAHV